MAVAPPLGDLAVEAEIARLLVAARPAVIKEWKLRAESWSGRQHFLPGSGLTASGPRYLRWDAAGAKAAVRERAVLRWRADLIVAVSRNAVVPAASFAQDEAAELLSSFAADEPLGLAWLASLFSAYLADDEAERTQLDLDLAERSDQYRRFGDEGHFLTWARPAVARLRVLSERVPRRKSAWDRFGKAFPSVLGKTCGGSLTELVAGVAESWAGDQVVLCDSSEASATEVELAAVERDLGVFAGVAVEPGLRQKALVERRKALNERLIAARDQSRRSSRAVLEAPVRSALAGDVNAWGQCASAITQHSESFEPGLAAAFLQAPCRAMISADPVSWAECLCGSVASAGGIGRDYRWDA